MDARLHKLRRARGRQLGFGIFLLVVSVVNFAWPVILFLLGLLTVFLGLGSGFATDSVEGIFAGSFAGLAIMAGYVLTLPVCAVATLVVALRATSIGRQLRPYGIDAVGARVVSWIAFGIATLNLATLILLALPYFIN